MSTGDNEPPARNLSVSEETILEACGDPPLPAMGIIEQVWERSPTVGSRLRGVTCWGMPSSHLLQNSDQN